MLRLVGICALCLVMLSGCAWVGRLLGVGGERAAPVEAQAPAPAQEAPVDAVPPPAPPTAPEPSTLKPAPQEPADSVSTSPPTAAPTASDISADPAPDLAPIGAAAFEQMKAKSQLSADFRMHSLVRCVATRLISALPDEERLLDWEVLVFDEPGAFAFVLPGARIGVHAGLLAIARTESQLAGALSHLLAHQRLGHLGPRVAASMAFEDAEVAVHVLNGPSSPPSSRTIYGALGLGHRVGRVVPFSETQEEQTDLAALEILLGAGYRPDDARAWWRALVATNAPLWDAQHPGPAARLAAIEVVTGTENVQPKVWCAE